MGRNARADVVALGNENQPMNDASLMLAAADALRATNEFAAVLSGRFPQDLRTGGQALPRAWIRQTGWRETAQGDPEATLRTVRFGLSITVDSARTEDPESELSRLAAVAQNALSGPLAPGVVPGLTVFESADFPTLEPDPLASVVLNGQAAYLVFGYGGRDPSLP